MLLPTVIGEHHDVETLAEAQVSDSVQQSSDECVHTLQLFVDLHTDDYRVC